VLLESTNGDTTLCLCGAARVAQMKGSDHEWFLVDLLLILNGPATTEFSWLVHGQCVRYNNC